MEFPPFMKNDITYGAMSNTVFCRLISHMSKWKSPDSATVYKKVLLEYWQQGYPLSPELEEHITFCKDNPSDHLMFIFDKILQLVMIKYNNCGIQQPEKVCICIELDADGIFNRVNNSKNHLVGSRDFVVFE